MLAAHALTQRVAANVQALVTVHPSSAYTASTGTPTMAETGSAQSTPQPSELARRNKFGTVGHSPEEPCTDACLCATRRAGRTCRPPTRTCSAYC